MSKIRPGFKPCPNFLWDIENLNSKDRDVILFLFSHSEEFIPRISYLAVKCGFGIKNTPTVRKTLLRIKESLENQPEEISKLEDFKIIKTAVVYKIRLILLSHKTIKVDKSILEIKETNPEYNLSNNLNNKEKSLNFKEKSLKNKDIEYKEEYKIENKEENKTLQNKKTAVVKKSQGGELAVSKKIEVFKQDLKSKIKEFLQMPEINGNRELLIDYYQYFMDYLRNRKNGYKDYLAAFRNCIRADWGGFRKSLRTYAKQTKTFKEKDLENKKDTFKRLAELDMQEDKNGKLGKPNHISNHLQLSFSL